MYARNDLLDRATAYLGRESLDSALSDDQLEYLLARALELMGDRTDSWRLHPAARLRWPRSIALRLLKPFVDRQSEFDGYARRDHDAR